MPDIVHQLNIAAPPDRVYNAITEQQGLAGWWTPDATAKAEAGSLAEFRFLDGQAVIRLEVATLEPNRAVRWRIREAMPEWAGTHITWDLAPADGGTTVRFGHRNYPSTEGSFASVNFHWAWHLISLKDYLETGRGRPGQLP
jgi:uncharacterized protein YndB with AHSA1/START domain